MKIRWIDTMVIIVTILVVSIVRCRTGGVTRLDTCSRCFHEYPESISFAESLPPFLEKSRKGATSHEY